MVFAAVGIPTTDVPTVSTSVSRSQMLIKNEEPITEGKKPPKLLFNEDYEKQSISFMYFSSTTTHN